MAWLSLKTGLRATEIFKLRAQDVDETAGVLYVTAKGGRREIVHAPQDVISMLLTYGSVGGEYIFSSRNQGERIKSTPDTFRRIVRKLGLDAAGGDSLYAVTFHTLRHTFASWLAQSGQVTLLELKEMMRHDSISMTQRYAHLIPGHAKKRLSIIDVTLHSSQKHS
jgi:Site-specific recombinase XerD